MSTDRIAGALSLTMLAGLLYLLFLVVRPFLTPLGWAAVLSIVFYPVYVRLDGRWGPGRSAAATTFGAALLVIVPMLLVMAMFVREASDAAAYLQAAATEGRLVWIERAWRSLEQLVPAAQRVNSAAVVADAARRGALFAVAQSGSVLLNVAGFLFNLIITLFATFFLLRDSRSIMAVVRRILPLDEPVREHLITQIRELVSVSVTSAAIIAAIQGLLGGIIFAAVGIEAPVFWGVVMAFTCLMPFGAWVIYLPAAIFLAVSGSLGRAIIVAGLGIGIVSSVDNVLRPALLSEGTTMNGLLILIALLGGVAVFGALGLVLGPILVACALALLKTYMATGKSKAAGKAPAAS